MPSLEENPACIGEFGDMLLYRLVLLRTYIIIMVQSAGDLTISRLTKMTHYFRKAESTIIKERIKPPLKGC